MNSNECFQADWQFAVSTLPSQIPSFTTLLPVRFSEQFQSNIRAISEQFQNSDLCNSCFHTALLLSRDSCGIPLSYFFHPIWNGGRESLKILEESQMRNVSHGPKNSSKMARIPKNISKSQVQPDRFKCDAIDESHFHCSLVDTILIIDYELLEYFNMVWKRLYVSNDWC